MHYRANKQCTCHSATAFLSVPGRVQRARHMGYSGCAVGIWGRQLVSQWYLGVVSWYERMAFCSVCTCNAMDYAFICVHSQTHPHRACTC